MEQTPPPKEFIEQVKDALEHLYDFPYLSNHPLGQTDPTTQRANELPGQQLRKTLLVAIESLNPQIGTPFRSPQTRLYDLIRLRYVEGMTIQEIAHEMRLSPRQTYRDLRRGEESVATILWLQQPNNAPPTNPSPPTLSSVEAELEQLQLHAQIIGMRSLIKDAKKAVERLATQRNIDFVLDMPTESVTVSTYPIIARQLLINLFSYTIQQAQAGTIKLRLIADNTQTTLTLQYKPETKTTDQLGATLSLELAERLKWEITQTDQTDQTEQRVITLQMSVHEPTILIIDDNQGFIDLVNRFLTDHACRVIAATNPQDGLQLITQQLIPDAILLDIMMPEMDGWELLQRVRGLPTMGETPIIICSVFNDPELAHSLGASIFLPKPINQSNLLATLQQVGILEQPYP